MKRVHLLLSDLSAHCRRLVSLLSFFSIISITGKGNPLNGFASIIRVNVLLVVPIIYFCVTVRASRFTRIMEADSVVPSPRVKY